MAKAAQNDSFRTAADGRRGWWAAIPPAVLGGLIFVSAAGAAAPSARIPGAIGAGQAVAGTAVSSPVAAPAPTQSPAPPAPSPATVTVAPTTPPVVSRPAATKPVKPAALPRAKGAQALSSASPAPTGQPATSPLGGAKAQVPALPALPAAPSPPPAPAGTPLPTLSPANPLDGEGAAKPASAPQSPAAAGGSPAGPGTGRHSSAAPVKTAAPPSHRPRANPGGALAPSRDARVASAGLPPTPPPPGSRRAAGRPAAFHSSGIAAVQASRRAPAGPAAHAPMGAESRGSGLSSVIQPFGASAPTLARAGMLATILVLAGGALLIALMCADAVGVGPRHDYLRRRRGSWWRRPWR